MASSMGVISGGQHIPKNLREKSICHYIKVNNLEKLILKSPTVTEAPNEPSPHNCM